MQLSNFGHIFIYDEKAKKESVLQNILSNNVYRTFHTGNAFEFIKYSKEITPDIIIFNLDDESKNHLSIIEHFRTENDAISYPIIMIQKINPKFSVHPKVAHYIHLPSDSKKLDDIIESYCIGHKKHDIMLLDNYSSHYDKLHQSLDTGGYSYFEVHNENAAELYLSKNNPQIVCIEYSPQMITAKHNLSHNQIFYVDRDQDITEIKKFLN